MNSGRLVRAGAWLSILLIFTFILSCSSAYKNIKHPGVTNVELFTVKMGRSRAKWMLVATISNPLRRSIRGFVYCKLARSHQEDYMKLFEVGPRTDKEVSFAVAAFTFYPEPECRIRLF